MLSPGQVSVSISRSSLGYPDDRIEISIGSASYLVCNPSRFIHNVPRYTSDEPPLSPVIEYDRQTGEFLIMREVARLARMISGEIIRQAEETLALRRDEEILK